MSDTTTTQPQPSSAPAPAVGLRGAKNPNPLTGGAVHHDLYKVESRDEQAEVRQARGMGLVFFAFFSLFLGGISLGTHHGLHLGLLAPLTFIVDGKPQTPDITNGGLFELTWSDGQQTTPEQAVAKLSDPVAPGKVAVALLVNDAWAGKLVADARQGAKPTSLGFTQAAREKWGISGQEAAVVLPGPRYAWLHAKLMHKVPTRFVILFGIAMGGLGLLVPSLLVPFNRFWMGYVAEPMGWFMTRVILSVFFFVFLTPYSLLMRPFSRDPLRRQARPKEQSYWEQRKAQRERTHYTHPY